MKFMLLLIGLLHTSTLWAQEYETIVEDVVFNSSSKVVLDEKTIRESQAPDLVTLITTQANITLFNNNFQPPQLFMRGGDSSHVLFIIDDVPVFDSSWSQRTLNLNSLDINNVRRIEVIKGGQTVLYGGQALAGVIKIYTFGTEFKNESKAYVTGGLPAESFDRGFDDKRVGGIYERNYSDTSAAKAAVRLMERRNQSPVLNSSRLYKQRNQNLDIGYESRGAINSRLRGFYFKDSSLNPTTVNVMGQQSIADSDVKRDDEQYGASGSFTLHKAPLQPRLAVYGQRGWRYFHAAPTTGNVNARFRSGLQGTLLDVTLISHNKLQINSGFSYQKEDFYLDDSQATLSVKARTADVFMETRGFYTQLKWTPTFPLILEAGARKEEVTHFKAHNSYQIGFTLFDDTKIEWVTGYRAPSAAQKYGIFENTNLEPEISQTYSLTQDFNLNEHGEISVTLFETSFSNYIETKSLGMGVLQYQNTAKVKTRGLETTATYLIDSVNSLQLSYAYQEPRDQVRHEVLRRRPRVSGTIRYFHSYEDISLMLEGTGVGSRYDFFGNNRYVFPGYFLVNTSARYKLDPNNQLSLRVSNWLDTRPEISIDYYAEGRSALLTYEHLF